MLHVYISTILGPGKDLYKQKQLAIKEWVKLWRSHTQERQPGNHERCCCGKYLMAPNGK